MTPVALQLDDLAVGYRHRGRETRILDHINGTVPAGRLVALVGPNGAGKSTLLRSVAGLQPPLGGDVRLDGVSTRRLRRPQIARLLAAVLTDRVDIGRMTVRDVVGLGRHPHSGWSGRLDADDQLAVDAALTAVSADHLADADLSELSDGQRQRVMVARGLAQEPSVLLLDEPTSFLDPPGRITVLQLLRQVSTARRLAVLVCTHDIEGVLRYADELWVAGRGTGVIAGCPEDLALAGDLERPFATAGVTFDVGSLTFRSDLSDRPPAQVSGTGSAASLARHVLNRAGWAVQNASGRTGGGQHAEAPLRVLAEPGSWVVEGSDLVHPTLASLHERVQGILSATGQEARRGSP